MNAMRVLYQMVRADFLQRARQYSFLVTLAAALYLAYGVATEKVWIVVGSGYRGVYNSAWIGALMAVVCSTFLSLAGFYVVKNTIQRDAETRVGQILAATPMSKSFYTLAKTISNFAVLASMVLVLMAAAVVMQLLHSEAGQLSIWDLWSPFLFIALPSMLITSALAILFETLPLLRGGLGNVLYFFLWGAGVALAAASTANDPSGLQLFLQSAYAALLKVDPEQMKQFSLTIGGARAVRTFYWSGVDWTGAIVLSRGGWMLVAIGISLLASVFFHRFDPAREWGRRKPRAPVVLLPSSPETFDLAITQNAQARQAQLSPLDRRTEKSQFVRVSLAELRLMLKGQRWWWYPVAVGLFVAGLLSPEQSRGSFLVAAWIWPVLVWSQMGSRELRGRTEALIFSSPYALYRQLPAVWTAGVLVAGITGGGVAVRLLLSGNWPALGAWCAASLFIPSLALALGVWTGSSKAFEALYTLWWYVGPAHQLPTLDFMGTTPASSNATLYLLLASALLAISFAGRRTRLAYA